MPRPTETRRLTRRERRERGVAAAAAPVVPSRAGRALFWIGLAGAVGVAVLLALHRLPTVRSEPGGLIEDPDALYHLRRASRTVEEGRLLPPLHDPFEDFPAGGVAAWPPLHDATLALLLRIGGSTPAEPRAGILVASLLPVLELALVVGLLGLVVRVLSGEAGALLAAWLAALTPALIRRSAFGELDHNATEVLGWALLAATALLLGRVRGSGPGADARAGLAWGALVLGALGFHAGLVLAAGVVAASHAPGDLLDRGRGGATALRLSIGFALAAALLWPLAGVRGRPDPADPWRLGPVYVLLLGLAAIGLGAWTLVAGTRAGTATRGRRLAAGLSSAAGFAVVALQPLVAWQGLARGLGFIGSRDPWLAAIDEFQPMVLSGAALSGACPALPAGLAAAILWLIRRREARDGEGFRSLLPAFLAFLAVTLLAAVQKRFLPPAVVLGALAAGLAWRDLAPSPARRWAVRGAAGLGLLAALPYLSTYLGGTLGRLLVVDDGPNPEAARCAAALTPVPSSPPSWGILAPWDMGHHLLALAGRPVALDNFGSWHPGFARKMRILLEPSPARAAAEMTELKLRYLFTVPPQNVLPAAIQSLGLPLSGWTAVPPLGDGIPAAGPGSAPERALVVRLHLRGGQPYDGDSAEDRAALARFRLRWESRVTVDGSPMPRLSLFELLP